MGLSLREGAVEPLGKYRNNMLFAILEMLGGVTISLDDPVRSLPEPGLNAVLYGDSGRIDHQPFGVQFFRRQPPRGRASPNI